MTRHQSLDAFASVSTRCTPEGEERPPMTRSVSRLFRRYVNSIGLVAIIAALLIFSGRSARTQQTPDRSGLTDPQITLAQQADCLAFGNARTVRTSQGGPLRAIGTEPGRPIRHPRPVDALG